MFHFYSPARTEHCMGTISQQIFQRENRIIAQQRMQTWMPAVLDGTREFFASLTSPGTRPYYDEGRRNRLKIHNEHIWISLIAIVFLPPPPFMPAESRTDSACRDAQDGRLQGIPVCSIEIVVSSSAVELNCILVRARRRPFSVTGFCEENCRSKGPRPGSRAIRL